ncbi:hypothetical protein J1614_005402 [Plenodomus biglobosus]|nr:hypothetical protein J1614_005402 [Plenodomus biglobosus]
MATDMDKSGHATILVRISGPFVLAGLTLQFCSTSRALRMRRIDIGQDHHTWSQIGAILEDSDGDRRGWPPAPEAVRCSDSPICHSFGQVDTPHKLDGEW